MKSSISSPRVRFSFNCTAIAWLAVCLAGTTCLASGTITQAGSLGTARRDHTATVLTDGRVLILGGQNAAGELASAEIFDPESRTFASVGSMSTPRVRHAATRLPDGKVLITGGRNASGPLATADLFDPAAAVPFRTVISPMGTARQDHTSTLLATGKVLVAGGDLAGTAELYDPATDTFSSSLIAMIEARAGQTATTLPENSVLLAGGGRRSVELFDLQTNAFLSWAAALAEIRTRHSAINAPNGSIYFIGGESQGTLEKFDVLGAGASLSLPLGAPSSAATKLANGNVLVAGPRLASLFNPTTNTLSPVPNATLLQRSGQTVTELSADKQILMAGGVDATNTYITSAALYNPATIATDKADYYPDEPVIVYGSGWKPGENVDLYVVDNLGWLYDSTVTANSAGQFTADPYFVVLLRHLGVTFDLTAIGEQSGLQAKHTFTDAPKVGSVTVGPQVGTLTYGTGGSATFLVTVHRGNGGAANGSFTADLSITTTLPPGVTASFSPNPVSLSASETLDTATLTITTTASAAANPAIPFTVRAATNSHDFSETSRSVEIGPKQLVVSGAMASDKVYDGNATATVNFSGATLVGLVGTDAVILNSASYSANFSDKNVGTAKPVAVTGLSLAGNPLVVANYTIAQPAALAANITAKNLTLTGAVANNKTYNGDNVATVNFAGATLVGVVSPDVVTVNTSGYTAAFNDKNVGTGKPVTVTGATLGGASAANYTLSQPTGLAADITAMGITGSFTANHKVYDGNTVATVLTRSVTGLASNDVGNVNLTGGTATFDTKDVGTAKIVTLTGATLTGNDAGNYTLASVNTTTANITAKSVTGSFTAENKVYDGTPDATVVSRSIQDRISGDNVSLSGGTATFADKNVGNGKTVTLSGATLGGSDAGNYMLAGVNTATANITAKSLTGSFTADNKVYDGGVTATVLTRAVSGAIAGEAVSLDGGTAAFDNKNVGNGKTVTLWGAALAGADAGNYNLGSVSTTTANITPLGITGSFTAANKSYDGTTATTVVTPSLTGVIAPDVVSLSGGTATFADKNAGTGKTVTLTGATLAGADAGNYTLNSVATATADITARALTVSATGMNKVYNGTTAATVTLSDDRVSGDALLTSYASASFADKNVGTNKPVTVTGISISGADAPNYTPNESANTTANITALGISGSFTAAHKVYDGGVTATVLTRSLAGAMGGDAVSLDGGTAAFDNKNVGTGKTVTLLGATLAGADAGNYSLASVSTATANITPLQATGSFTAANKVYDGGVAASVLTRSVSNAVSGDDVSLAGGTATFDNKNAATGKTVTLVGAALTGEQAGNYSLQSVTTTLATITPRPITIKAVDVSVSWAQPLQLPSYSIELAPGSLGLGAGDSLSIFGTPNYATTPASPVNAGVYPIYVGGLSHPNYHIAYPAEAYWGKLTIIDQTKPEASITALDPVPLNTAATLQATITDIYSGNSNIIKFEYRIDDGAWLNLNATLGSPEVNGTAIIGGFSSAGVKQVIVRGTDAGGNTSDEARALLAIYDPNGGFVTGGGWIWSPAGASTLFPSAAGKASFGFNAKYQKGATKPSGQTEFQFQAGDLRFKSTDYEWLVVSGAAKAQFKGTGTINGSGSYGFLLTATDGDNYGTKKADTFRIKIWEVSTGNLIYDNQLGAADSADPTTTLGGGSIVIHDGSKKT